MYHPSLTILNMQGFPKLQVTMQSFWNPREHDVDHLNNVQEQNQWQHPLRVTILDVIKCITLNYFI